jgi:hypothetical protein
MKTGIWSSRIAHAQLLPDVTAATLYRTEIRSSQTVFDSISQLIYVVRNPPILVNRLSQLAKKIFYGSALWEISGIHLSRNKIDILIFQKSLGILRIVRTGLFWPKDVGPLSVI